MAKSFKSCFLGLFSRPSTRPSTSASTSKGRTGHKQVDGGDYKLLPESPPMQGTSCVYWGQLKDGAQIAVKRLNCSLFKDIEEFCREAQFLGKFRHRYLLSLRGYCAEGRERMLVFDYMHNSSLLAHLHGDLDSQGQLDWQKRMAVAIGCAEGLAYLHHYSNPQLVHGDIKSTNVLLSSNFEPRIVDFGMSNLLKDAIPKPRGASGYAAPEDSKGEEDLTKRSDVFSFGILLLELVSGKNPAEKVLGDDSRKLSIVEWAQNVVIGGKPDDLIDPRLNGDYNREELETLLNTAIMCAQEKPENRLSMLEVVAFLSGGFQKQETPIQEALRKSSVQPGMDAL